MGGYLPDPLNPQRLQFEEGFITRSISENKWVIIDEINRADVDKAFGELFTVLTGNSVNLPYYNFVNESDGTIKERKLRFLLRMKEKYLEMISKITMFKLIGELSEQ